MVSSNRGTITYTVCEIISGVDVENRHFTPLYSDCRPPHGRLQRGKWTQLVSSLAQGGGENSTLKGGEELPEIYGSY